MTSSPVAIVSTKSSAKKRQNKGKMDENDNTHNRKKKSTTNIPRDVVDIIDIENTGNAAGSQESTGTLLGEDTGLWVCPICTYENDAAAFEYLCGTCEEKRPKARRITGLSI